MRRLLLFLLFSAPCFGQSLDGFPCYNGGAGQAGLYNQAGTLNGSGDKIYCKCGIPSGGTGTPLDTVGNLGAYSADTYVNFASSQMPQRSMDWCAPSGQTTLVNNYPTLVYLGGGGDKHITSVTMWGQVTVSSTTYPGFVFTVADPNQNNSGVGAFNVISAAYETDGSAQLCQAITAPASTVYVKTISSTNFPSAAEINTLNTNGTPLKITVEGETVSVTAATANPGSCNPGGGLTGFQFTVSPSFASNHTNGYVVWTSDSTGKHLADASLYSAVTLMNAIACNGWGDRHDIRLLGVSNGAWVIAQLAMMGAADKTTYRLAANNEYSCAVADDWNVTAADFSSPPLDQSAVTVLSSDTSEPLLNAMHLGLGTSGNIGVSTALWDSGCTGNGSSKCSLGVCTVNGLTPNGTMSAVDLHAHQNSPQQNAPGNTPGTCTAWNSCPGIFHTPTYLPIMAVNVGNADTNVTPDQASCFSTTFNTPYLLANDCNGGSCGHGVCEIGGNLYPNWYVKDQCVSFELHQLGLQDSNYGSTLAWNTTDLPHGTNGSAYSQSIAVTGGTSPYTYTVVNGALSTFVGGGSTGLSLNSVSGAITGTPGASGYIDFTVRACDSETPQICAVPDREFTIGIMPVFDSYGALNNKAIPGCTPGYWQLKKINGRWLWASPTNCNASFSIGMQDAGYSNLNSTAQTYYGGSFGSSFFHDVWNHLQDWGFNTTDAFSDNSFANGTYVQTPFITLVRPWAYAAQYAGHYKCTPTSAKMKEIDQASPQILPNTVYNLTAAHHFVGMLDIQDPDWPNCTDASVTGTAANNGTDGTYVQISGLATSKYARAIELDEMDEWEWTRQIPDSNDYNPNWAYAVLVSNPCEAGGTTGYAAVNGSCNGTGSNIPLFSKACFIDGITGYDCGFGVGKGYLSNKYTNIAGVNSAWHTTYTTFGTSSGSGGCTGWSQTGGTVCTGMADENGALTVGVGSASDPFTLSGLPAAGAAAIKADFDNYNYYLGYRDYNTTINSIRSTAGDTHHVIISHNYYGQNSDVGTVSCAVAPSPDYLYAFRDAVANNSAQGIIMGCHDAKTIGSDAINKQIYDNTCTGTLPVSLGGNCVPVMPWLNVSANLDSAKSPTPNPYSDYATQALRGAAYGTTVTDLWNAQGTNGDNYVPGLSWWDLYDSPTETINFGFGTVSSNFYNGNDSIMPSGVNYDSINRGGESGNWGQGEGSTFTSQVTKANLGIEQNLQSTNFGNAPQTQVTGNTKVTGATR